MWKRKKKAENSGIDDEFHSFISFFSILSIILTRLAYTLPIDYVWLLDGDVSLATTNLRKVIASVSPHTSPHTKLHLKTVSEGTISTSFQKTYWHLVGLLFWNAGDNFLCG